jgi:hypothetical protein
MMLGEIALGRRALNSVTLLRKALERSGRHMKCVFGEALAFIVKLGSSEFVGLV